MQLRSQHLTVAVPGQFLFILLGEQRTSTCVYASGHCKIDADKLSNVL